MHVFDGALLLLTLFKEYLLPNDELRTQIPSEALLIAIKQRSLSKTD